MRKFSKLISLICALAMVIAVMPVTTQAAFGGDHVDFNDYSGQNVSSYLTNKEFMVVSNPLSITDEGANGKMLCIGRGGRVVRWYDSSRNTKPNITDDFVYEFTFMQKTKGAVVDIGTISCSPWNAANYGFQFSSDGTNLTLKHGGGTATVVANYEANTVYTVKFLVKLSDKTLRIWINDEEKLTGETITFLNNISHVSRLDFNGATAEMYIGRITLSQYIDMEAEVGKLGTEIAEARAEIDGVDVGDYLGQYPQSAVDTANAVVDEVEAVYNDFLLNTPDDIALIDAERAKLAGAVAELLASANSAYVQKYSMDFDSKTLQQDSWNQYKGHSETVTLDGNKVLYAANLTGSEATRVLRVFPESVGGMAVISFSFMQDSKAPVTAISEIKSSNYSEKDTIFTLSSDGTNICLGSLIVIANYEAGRWYDMKFDVNPGTKVMQVYVDGERVLSDTTIGYMGTTARNLDRWETNIAQMGSSVYIDNIRIEANMNTEFDAAAEAVRAIFGDTDNVVNDITLPASGEGFSFEWSSDNEAVISADGNVTRSEDGDEVVTLTALISKNGHTSKKEYVLTVPGIVYENVVSEDFGLYLDGEYPAGWTITSGRAVVTDNNGEKYVSVSGKMTKNATYKNVTPRGFAGVSFMQDTKAAVNSVMGLSQSEQFFNIRTDGTNIIFAANGEEEVIVENYEAGKWYDIRTVYDTDAKKVYVYVDGEEVIYGKDMLQGTSSETVKLILDAQNTGMNIDNIAFGTAEVSSIEIAGASDTVLRPASGKSVVAYKVLFKDADGNLLAPKELNWTIKNENGNAAENITAENNSVIVIPESESGVMTVTATLKNNALISDNASLEIIAQEVKEIRISGTTKITRAGEYNYTAEVISKYDVVLPSDTIVWSVSGNARIDENGKLTISSLSGSSITVTATLGDKEGTLKVKLEAPSAGGGGGGGGGSSSGGGGITASPVKIPEDPTDNGAVQSFNDVPVSYWAADAIYALTKEGIVSGVGGDNFAPEEKVSRSQFAKMLVEAFDIKASGTAVFKDADKNAWYYTYINAANGAGIINGYPDGTFGVDDAITRQDAAVMLARALDYKGIKSDAADLDYNDNDRIASYAIDAIGVMLDKGIMSGRGNNNFDPEANMTRAEAATVFYRMLKLVEGR